MTGLEEVGVIDQAKGGNHKIKRTRIIPLIHEMTKKNLTVPD